MPYNIEFPSSASDPEASYMPNKTIYVADADLPVFERAQELAGENLSATIAGALRRYVQAEEARQQGFVEVSVKVGSHRNFSVKRFMGRELARRRERDEPLARVVTQTVFQTARGRFAVYTRATPDWSRWATGWGGDWDVDVDVDVDVAEGSWRVSRSGEQNRTGGVKWSAGDWSTWTADDERTLEIYETLDELKANVDEELAAAVEQALRGEEDEFLDI
ncbi:MAG TPA: EXLDI protein [Ktedonobacterales bacterium]